MKKQAISKGPRGPKPKYGKGIKTTTVSARVPVQFKERAQKTMNNMCRQFYRELLEVSKKHP